MEQLADVATEVATQEESLAVRGARRNGIDRLFLAGRLDISTAPILQRDLDSVVHAGGALVLDLDDLTHIDRFGCHALERASGHSSREAWRLSIVNCHGAVRRVLEKAGCSHLLGASGVSDLLDAGDEGWSPISLPSLLGKREKTSRAGRRS